MAIILLSDAEKVSSAIEKTYRGFGFAVLILGPLASWVSSFFLYGFGELIETNCEIARNTRNRAFGGNSVGKVISDVSVLKQEQAQRAENYNYKVDKRNSKQVIIHKQLLILKIYTFHMPMILSDLI